jgi:hypothetical protein
MRPDRIIREFAMQNRPYFLLIYGCSISGKQQSNWNKIIDAARRLNDEAPHADRIHLISNFDSVRGYIGLPLATSNKRLANELSLPLMPSYFTISLDEVLTWLNQRIGSDRLRLTETQWSRIRAAGRSILSPGQPSEVPLARTMFVHDIDERQRYGGELRLLPT